MAIQSGLRIRLENGEGTPAVAVEGELCLAAAGQLRDVLLKTLEGGGPAVADLSGVTAIDLSGLQVLCSAHRTFQGRGSSFVLRGVSKTVREAAIEAGFNAETSVCPFRQGEDCLWRSRE